MPYCSSTPTTPPRVYGESRGSPRRSADAFRVHAIRLDSEPLPELAREARAILDAAGLEQVEIIASGGLDETRIAEIIADGAPIDGFGVGTRASTSADSPTFDAVYKLAAYDGRGE